MKKLELAEATASLANYVENLERETLILSSEGEPVAVLMPIENVDLETISLSNNPEFIAILEESRASLKEEGGIPLDEMKRRLGLS